MQMVQSNPFMTNSMSQEQNPAMKTIGGNDAGATSLLQQMQRAASHPLKKRDFTLSTNDAEDPSPTTKKRRINVSGMGSWWKFGSMPTGIKDLAKQESSKREQAPNMQTPAAMDPTPLPPATIQIQRSMPSFLENPAISTHFNAAQLEAAKARIAAVSQLASVSQAPPVAERSDESDSDSGSGVLKYRQYQAENWSERYEALIDFRKNHGHCLVPNSYPEDVALAQWVKRQRYQYKLKQEGKRSTLSDERVEALENIGFVWDSHRAVWDERFNELIDYKRVNGNCNVPSRYTENRQLAVWVKRQRRQYKFYRTNKPSSMTEERITRLESIGFEWDLRSRDFR